MGWLSSLFSSAEYSRNGQTLSSTHEAFSLPTSSPTFPTNPDVFTPTTPELDPNAPNYTYPPRGTSAYGYVRTSGGLGSRPTSASLLPVHHTTNRTPMSSKLPYPPLSNTWQRIRTWLSREYPELGDTLNYGIIPQNLQQIELQFGFTLPPVLRESYLCVDGQEAESAAGCSEGLFFGLKLLPLEDVLEEWRFWREVDDDPTTGANPHLRQAMQSIPPGWVRKNYSQRGWIPVIADKAGNYVGVDLDPDDKGSVGQVIVFGRDFDTKVVLWRGDGLTGWAKWLASFADELESGEGIDIGNGNDGSEDSEDDVGYESYFYDGTGRGQGDGGGDIGLGPGLRLTGQYRGWNVLEAWADRSSRRWHEAGVIPDISLSPQDEEAQIPASKLEQDLSSAYDDKQEHISLVTKEHSRPTPVRDVPTISVTKAPAPRPVALPMPDDILPVSDSPSSPSSSFDEDLESARSPGMREVFQGNHGLVPEHPKSLPVENSGESGESGSGSPSLDFGLSSVTRSHSTSSVNVTTRQPTTRAGALPIPDLMADSVPAMPTKPIAPSSPAYSQAELDEVRVDVAAEDTLLAPNATVRLVGGGRVVGVASDVSEIIAESEADRKQQKEGDNHSEIDVRGAPFAASKAPMVQGGNSRMMSGLAGL